MRTVLMMIGLCAATSVAAQGMYRWVDANGKVHYSDKAPVGANAEQKRLQGNVVETSLPGFEAQQAAKNFPVKLYTHPQCKAMCDDARKLLRERGVPFAEVSVTTNEIRDELVKLSGSAEVPVMTVGKQVQKGFEAGAFGVALDTAGYPKAASPGQRAQAQAADAAPKAVEPVAPKAAPAPKKGPYAVD